MPLAISRSKKPFGKKLHRMHRRPTREVLNLVTTRKAIGHHPRLRIGLLYRRNQRRLCHLSRNRLVALVVAKPSRHATAARGNGIHREARRP